VTDFALEKRELLLSALRGRIEGEVRFDEPTRLLYATDASICRMVPLGVVVPRTPDDLHTAVSIALETRTPITARGGGTSLSGQSIGPGIVIDCSRYLDEIGPVDVANRTVRVQPGVVLDRLNRDLAAHGLMFGPDVATANRATIGGMIGNNSAGARSIVYGRTVDHVKSLGCILSDGSKVEFAKAAKLPTGDPRNGSLRDRAEAEVLRIVGLHRDEIDRRFPKILRRVSGYNLGWYVEKPPDDWSMIPLLVGSEGTLAFTTHADLNLIPRPKHRGLVVPQFDSLASALDAVAVCLEAGPSAVELIDSLLIALSRTQRSLQPAMAAIRGNPEALLMVEFTADDPAEIDDKIARIRVKLGSAAGISAVVTATDPALRDPLWNLRSGAVPLLWGIPGQRKPVTFVEDTAVSPDKMPEFVREFREILRVHGTSGAFYGHASVGCLHIRPLLDLHDTADLETMRAIAGDVAALVRRYNGSLSGEHGDGLIRSEWNEAMYGPVVYDAFRQVKRIFDPANLFNPGRIVDAPRADAHLRYMPTYRAIPLPTVSDYSSQGGFFASVELCNGAGVCRKTQGGTMCPSFRVTRDEADSTRGRANALREVLQHDIRQPLRERWLADVMDLCISCKACKSECPSNVDMAKLNAEFQQAYYARRLRPPSHYLARYIHRLHALGAPLAPILNWLGRRGPVRGVLHHIGGIDSRRPLPQLSRNHFRRWFARRRGGRGGAGKVLLFDDCLTSYTEPEIGRAAVKILEAAGRKVELVSPVCCGRAMISRGFLHDARELILRQIPGLLARLEDGVPILGLEPSCLLTLADEWPDLVPGEATQRIAAAVRLADAWIGQEMKAGRIIIPLRHEAETVVLHGHCHQKAIVGMGGTVSLLGGIPGVEVVDLDSGCCGMAGTFGYERTHYDISVRMAELALLPGLREHPEATVCATGTSCRHQIGDLTQRRGEHPLVLMARRLV